MAKKRYWILLTVVAVALDVVAIVLLVPVFISPADHPHGTLFPIGLVFVSLLLGVAVAALRNKPKAPTQSS